MLTHIIANITEKVAAFFLAASRDYRITDPSFSHRLREQAYKMLGLRS